MKVTVCELHDEPALFAVDWDRLVSHLKAEGSQLVLLPEMPFSPWFGGEPTFQPAIWQAAVKAHDDWLALLPMIAPAVILSSRPIDQGGKRLNEGFLWDHVQGYHSVHQKHYLPNEAGVWEAAWYQRGDKHFELYEYEQVRIGLLLCSELWALEQASAYGNAGVHILAVPRVTESTTLDKWLVGGRAASIVSGAFCISSNRVSAMEDGPFGGQGWIIGPDGQVLCLTSRQQPFVTLDIDIPTAEHAKTTYPRYLFSSSN
jgi:N-carbamoylputrescine amidase